MSMHLRNSREMMGNEEQEGWWNSRTGLEQKLIILGSLLFVLSFALTITVIVLSNRQKSGSGDTTSAPSPEPTGTGETTIPTEEPVTETTVVPTSESDSSPDITTVPVGTTEATSESPATTAKATTVSKGEDFAPMSTRIILRRAKDGSSVETIADAPRPSKLAERAILFGDFP